MQQKPLKKQTLNQKKTPITSAAIILACGVISPPSQAALASNAILQFSPGVISCIAGLGTAPKSCTYGSVIKSGSYFGMDSNGGGVSASERTAIVQNVGLVIGSSQAASGSHTGKPNGTESPGIDKPWNYFGNTGMHQSTKAITILSDDGAGNVTLDFSGWDVTWNGIPKIDMGKNAWEGNANGVATVICGATCANGDTYTLDYSATVPVGDPSHFGNVPYDLHLEGTVSTVPIPGAVWLFGSGLLALAGVARRKKTA